MDYSYAWEGKLTKQMKDSYDENGFIILRDFLEQEEVDKMNKVIDGPDGILKHGYTAKEPCGVLQVKQTLASYPGNDVSGMLARSEKVVNTSAQLLNDEVYHWCSMYMIKDARVGGEHVWHQDYGFWYNDGCLYPDLITVWFALDKCTRENSCKQVLRGSHKLGRLDHHQVPNGQLEADPVKVNHAARSLDRIYLEMNAGDVFLHHGNMLHRSDENRSEEGRRAFLIGYNTKTNSPTGPSDYPVYNRIQTVPDSAIKECTNYTDFRGKGFRYGA